MSEKKDIKAVQEECTHLGTHNSLIQNVLQAPQGIIAVISHNCAYCGKVFVLLHPLDLKAFKKKFASAEDILK